MDTIHSVGLLLGALNLTLGALGMSPAVGAGVVDAESPGETPAHEDMTPASATAAPLLSADDRSDVGATAYVGYAIDTFAAGELGRYLNPSDSAVLKERWIGGFDIEMRLTRRTSKWPQVWLYLETLHGVRSADVDCSQNADLPVCKPFSESLSDPTERSLYILRKATSLEGFVGARFEIFTLHAGGTDPMRPYLSAQAGFVSVAGGGEDVLENLNFAAGLTVTGGDFQGSYLEAGMGTNQVFASHPRRFVIDGLLSWRLPFVNTIRPFAQIVVDSDLGPGADAIQTYFGFDFEVERLFGSSKNDNKRNNESKAISVGAGDEVGDPESRRSTGQLDVNR